MAVTRELKTILSFSAKLGPLNTAFEKINRFKGAITAIAGIATGVVGGAVGFAVKQAGEFEQLSIAFTTMLKDGDKAKKLLMDLESFAARTPFEFDELAPAAKKLLAFGVGAEDIVQTMTNLGNIASGVGKERLPSIVLAFGKIKTKGKATMEELNILLEAGVPILQELSTNFGIAQKDIFKMVSDGKVGFDDVNKALSNISTGSGQFAGLMEEQSKSLFGLLSTLKTEISFIARDIGQELLPDIKRLAKEMIDFLLRNKAAFVKFAKALISGIKLILNNIDRLITIFAALTAGMLIANGPFIIGRFKRLGTVLRRNVAVGARKASRAVAGLNLKLLLIPLVLAILADDFRAFFQGKRSLIGLLINGLRIAGKQISEAFSFENLAKLLNDAKEIINTIKNQSIKKTAIQGFILPAQLIKKGFDFIGGGSGSSSQNTLNQVNNLRVSGEVDAVRTVDKMNQNAIKTFNAKNSSGSPVTN